MAHISMQWKIRGFFLVDLIILGFLAESPFNFLVLNTFLGYVPIELAFQIKKIKSVKSLPFLLFFVIWLAFYPNAPYLMTDLFHLSLLNPHDYANGLLSNNPRMWLDFGLLMVSMFGALLIGTYELNVIAQRINQAFRIKFIWVLPTILMAASGIGVYIGRFLRIHSLYLFLTPTWFIKQILNMWNLRMVFFVTILTIVQLAVLWLLNEIKKAD